MPRNITSGVTTIQGTTGRLIVDGAFLRRNAREGSDFLNLNVRLSRTFQLRGGVQLEALAEGFNLTNHVNVLTRNGNFGAGLYPPNPSSTFGQITAVGESRAFQFGARPILRSAHRSNPMARSSLLASVIDLLPILIALLLDRCHRHSAVSNERTRRVKAGNERTAMPPPPKTVGSRMITAARASLAL